MSPPVEILVGKSRVMPSGQDRPTCILPAQAANHNVGFTYGASQIIIIKKIIRINILKYLGQNASKQRVKLMNEKIEEFYW